MPKKDRVHSRLLLAQNIRITGVEHSHGGAAEELSAGDAQIDLSGRKGKPENIYPPKS